MTTDELKAKAKEAWEAPELRYRFSETANVWFLELGGGKSIATSGAYWVGFTGRTLEEACEDAIKKAPSKSMDELRAEALENMRGNL